MSVPANTGGSRGYNSRADVSSAPGAFALILGSDFGQQAPGSGATQSNSGSGSSWGTGTAYLQFTWVTAEGESLPASQISAASASGENVVLNISAVTVPVNGSPVIGWRAYSASSTGAEKLNTGVGSSVVTAKGTLSNVIPIATTSATLTGAGTGASVPTADESGIQFTLPSIASDAAVDLYFIVPNTGSQWKVQKRVEYMRPDGVADPAGISWTSMDCIQPDYPGVSATVVAFAAGVSQTVANLFVMNGYAFVAVAGGTTASAFIGFSAFNTTRYALTTDGTVTWMSLGKAALIRSRVSNLSGTAATPQAQAFEIFAI